MNEADRILEENRRRERELDPSRYAPWQPAELFMRQGRERLATQLLREVGVFPERARPYLEIGVGTRGWIPTFLGWGVDSDDLFGIEIDPRRAEIASQAFPGCHIEVGDAQTLRWSSGFFRIVVLSTVLTSILDPETRQAVCWEADRVLHPGGAILIYDFRFNNPSNANVRKLTRRKIRSLFPDYRRVIRSATLAPPVARAVVPKSWTLATCLETLPFLRSHLVAVVVKPATVPPKPDANA